jgi:hypothetical protein
MVIILDDGVIKIDWNHSPVSKWGKRKLKEAFTIGDKQMLFCANRE